jgi:hypothetical protein
MPRLPHLAVITCAVLEDEVLHFAQDAPHIVHIEIMEQGLHNDPPRLRRELQATIERIEAMPEVEAIVLGYGLCSRGTEGVTTSRCPLVMARAHDCITLLLGSKERYAQYVAAHPGTYWYSPGWNRHHIPPGPQRHALLRAEYVEKYGEDNADFLMDAEQHWFSSYNRATYIHLGVANTPEDVNFTRDCARWLRWEFDCQAGDTALLRALLNGDWDDDRFVVLQPGEAFALCADENVLTVVALQNA